MKLTLRSLLVAALLKMAVVSAHAQTAPPAAEPAAAVAPASAVPAAPAAIAEPLLSPELAKGKYKDYLNVRYAADKEARAAVHMFNRKQTGGVVWLVGGGAFLGFLTSQTGTKTDANGVTTTFTISPFGYLVFAGLPVALAIGKFSRFNNGELYKMLREYDKTHKLPGYVVAKLGKSDYE
ncbi:hypothetical protein Q3A66_00030 [Hymenobacter sp. BT770]|uniref:hypothetical protein n=1 Tax=Hymenobacter sp. BT770 TaxID=2886942 RepID=UPI001D0F7DEC|nr:hypothetical protein [Hymenobacter sp. BT770]MCC3151944.1 hypothetical protein [Hymenobacter sp. BT770]MDO3413433.1 hypothetical protein [Hymenobacter sp. BT770]